MKSQIVLCRCYLFIIINSSQRVKLRNVRRGKNAFVVPSGQSLHSTVTPHTHVGIQRHTFSPLPVLQLGYSPEFVEYHYDKIPEHDRRCSQPSHLAPIIWDHRKRSLPPPASTRRCACAPASAFAIRRVSLALACTQGLTRCCHCQLCKDCMHRPSIRRCVLTFTSVRRLLPCWQFHRLRRMDRSQPVRGIEKKKRKSRAKTDVWRDNIFGSKSAGLPKEALLMTTANVKDAAPPSSNFDQTPAGRDAGNVRREKRYHLPYP